MIKCDCGKKYIDFNKWIATCKNCMFGISYWGFERKAIMCKFDGSFVLYYCFKTNIINKMHVYKYKYLSDSVEDFNCNPSNNAKDMRKVLIRLKENIMFA